MRFAAVAVSLLLPSMAQAEGTAEVAITLQGRTTFLSADNTASALPMVARDGAVLHLTFAQLHLGFPLPPILRLTLREGEDGWSVDTVSYDDPMRRLALSAPAFRVTGDGLQIVLRGEVLVPLPLGLEMRPIVIEVSLPD